MKDFHIAPSAPELGWRLDLAPSVSEQLHRQPVVMDRKTHREMTRGKLEPEARIDLHGMTLAQAHPQLVNFLLGAQDRGSRLVLVITGKGKRGLDEGPIPQRQGVLRHQVPQWLRLPPLGAVVMQVTEAHLKHGGSGAYYVYLRRMR
jgi:DNA-nicking Smr family endonuclease